MVDVLDELLKIFSEFGIFIDEDEYDSELSIDSIQFININIKIEEVFSISVDDEYLLFKKLPTIRAFESMVKKSITI
jgi:acyl carrier protein